MTTTLDQLVAASVRRFPEHEALRAGPHRLTYRALWAAAGALARRIRERHPAPPGRVVVAADRGVLGYVAYLAVLRAGGTVLPLHPDVPPQRNGAVCAAAGVSVVVAADERLTGLVPAAGRVSPGDPDELVEAGLRHPWPDGSGAGPDQEAYLLFTSGSTGTPKGVPIRHRNVCAYLADRAREFGVGPGKRLSQTFDLTFDPSVFDMFVAWSAGATVVPPTRDELLDPAAFVARERITHWFSVPSVVTLAKRMRTLRRDSMPTLEWSLFAGEPLTWQQAAAWRAAAPLSRLGNLYGPTEVTITCTGYELPAAVERWPTTVNGTVPIGVPHEDMEVVLDHDGRLGDEGELCVRGPQRFAGYLDGDDDTGRFARVTGTAVTTDPTPAPDRYYRTGDLASLDADGNLVHRGRLDTQVKLHGYRVELGEVEAAMRSHDGVEDAVVTADGDTDLVGGYTGDPVSTTDLVAHLQTRLPWYMTPSRVAHLTHMPLNPNGKIDRKAVCRALTASALTPGSPAPAGP